MIAKESQAVHVCTQTMQIGLNESLVACFNYGVISPRLACNAAPPIGDMFIQRLWILQGHYVSQHKRRGTANEKEPFISPCHSMLRDNRHFEMHYGTHKLSGALSLGFRVAISSCLKHRNGTEPHR